MSTENGKRSREAPQREWHFSWCGKNDQRLISQEKRERPSGQKEQYEQGASERRGTAGGALTKVSVTQHLE